MPRQYPECTICKRHHPDETACDPPDLDGYDETGGSEYRRWLAGE